MKKVILLILILFFGLPAKIFASNFSTDYGVTYEILENAKTKVSFNVTLTNTTEQYYASSYNMNVGFQDIRDVKASDPEGEISPKITKTSKGQTIEINFNKKVVGLGNKLNFTLFFETGEVATSVGNIWEINIPGLSNQSDFSSFNVGVLYPGFLGKPASIKPDNSNVLRQLNGNRINFTKSDLGTSGISIAFGDHQIYSFDLTYHLQNKNLFPVETEIALVPSTNYQDVLISSLSPKPKNVVIDEDGNWLAKYILSPSQNLNIKLLGKAKVYLSPKSESVSEAKLSKYLKQKPYWESNSSEIKEKVKEFSGVSEIYNFVVNNLTYDFERVTDGKPRLGALGVLKNPTSAVCLEFTDLFVALARASGIPARETDGFAHTNNSKERPLTLVKDVLHAWPQYYDRSVNAWIMVDPTWGNTTNGIDYFNTLDFDHFTFVVKGVDSSYPIPAGGYKTSKDLSSKDVNVSLSSEFDPSFNIETKIELPSESLPGIPIKGKIIVENGGNSLSPAQNLKIFTKFLKPDKETIKIPFVPPYGFIEVPVSFAKTPLLTNQKDIITITIDKNLIQKSILVSPFTEKTKIAGGVLIVVFVLLFYAAARSWRLHFYRKR